MTLPVTVRLNFATPAPIRVSVPAPFPARVRGVDFVTVTKLNGVWSIGIDYSLLGSPIPVSDPSTKVVAIFDLLTGIYNLTTINTLLAAAFGTYRMVTVAGDVAVAAGDTTILVNKTVGAATNIILPASASRQGVPIKVKDYKQDANTHNITFVLAGTETIDGMLQAAADTAGLSKIDINGDEKTLFPLTSGGWYT